MIHLEITSYYEQAVKIVTEYARQQLLRELQCDLERRRFR
jgi:hypothetical protein